MKVWRRKEEKHSKAEVHREDKMKERNKREVG